MLCSETLRVRTKRSTTWEPTNPAPPVTRTRLFCQNSFRLRDANFFYHWAVLNTLLTVGSELLDAQWEVNRVLSLLPAMSD